MLKFKFYKIAYLISIFILLICRYLFDFNLIWFVFPTLIYISILVWGVTHIQANFFIKSYNKVENKNNEVAITFDDGPDPENTLIILEILKKHGILATFFCIGHKIQDQCKIIQSIIDEGHLIGNHSFTHHFFFDLKSEKEMIDELKQTNQSVIDCTGKEMKYFRPPYGVTNPNLAKAIKATNLYSIGWSVRPMDTVAKSDKKLIASIVENLKSGDIIVLHDTSKITLKNLEQIIISIKSKGFCIVSLDQLLKIKAYA